MLIVACPRIGDFADSPCRANDEEAGDLATQTGEFRASAVSDGRGFRQVFG
jgi:hypothetical protein